MLMKKFAAVAICCLIATVSTAQETKVEADAAVETAATAAKTSQVATPDAPQRVTVMLNKDGSLEGTTLNEATKKAVANSKVTLTAEGKVVDAVTTDESGTFAFANVAPGAYQVLGSADGFVGSTSYDVVPYAEPAIGSPCSVGMCGASSDIVYDSYASEPVSSFSTCNACSNPCNTCGGGLGGGSFGGGRLGGRLGGGLLSNPRIGLIGLAGLAGLGGGDTSPTN